LVQLALKTASCGGTDYLALGQSHRAP
jgi:hypothetical protein